MNGLRAPGAVLFDLDGTLADTGPDLAYALNRTLEHFDRAPLPYLQIRPHVSHGAMALVRLGFGLEPGQPGFDARRQFLLDVYAANLCRDTVLFPGMDATLLRLERDGIPWGIVTNKPAWLTDPLVQAMGLDRRAGCVVSGDTCAQRKPHPEPLLHACRLIGREPAAAWFVGDAGRDMLAGRAAGCLTVAALYGYIHPDDPPDTWGSDLVIEHPEQLGELLQRHAATG